MRRISDIPTPPGSDVAPALLSMSAAICHSSVTSESFSPGAGEEFLARAFVSFSEAAASLEHSYSHLQGEVARLRQELETTNRDLISSLEENRRMRERLDRILEGLPCGVLVIESNGRVSLSNPEAERLVGVKPDRDVPHPLRQVLDRVQAGRIEFEFNGTAGRGTWMSIQRARLGGPDGGLVFILQDITEVKRLQNEHETLRRRQALAELSAGLAHEIRNPLGSLELFAGLLAEADLAPEKQAWVEHLRAGLRTLSATVNNVLHFHSPPPLALVPTDLDELLGRLEQFLQPLAQQAQVHITCRFGLGGVKVPVDRHRLEQVVLNLALNAFRLMPGGGVLRIASRVSGGKIEVAIADTGPGISPDILEQIFQPGFTTRAGSPGLGLAVCQTIMQQHGGSIRARSRPGQGATFTLEFPCLGERP